MDLIASHRQGLVEQLDIEAGALAGRGRDCAQRGIVYFHLFDHGGAAHGHALLCAQAALDLPRALAAMERAVRRRWWWRRDRRAALAERVARFADEALDLDRRRCAMMVLAYRLAATPGLAGEARARLDSPLADAFEAFLHARREATLGEAQRWALFDAHDLWLTDALGAATEAALAALDWPLERALVARAERALRVSSLAYARANRPGGWERLASRVRADSALPHGFAGNPGQHYYRMQRALADKRRKAVFDTLDQGPTVALAVAA